MIKSVLGKILLYSFLVFFVVRYGPDFGFAPLQISSTGGFSDLVVYLFLGLIFWIVYDLIRRVIQVVTKPLSRVTLGIVGVVINIVTIYGFAYIVSFVVDSGIAVQTGTPLEIVLFSLIVRLVDFLF